MGKISQLFKSLQKNRRKALICYVTCGDPNLAETEKLVYALEESGADIVELGIPFSDPLADGPIIQASHQRALKHNTNLADAFLLVSKVRKNTQIPLVFMSSINLIYNFGTAKFFKEAKRAGVDGVIIPDFAIAGANLNSRLRLTSPGVDVIYLAAPNTSPSRLKKIAQKSQGFIYLISFAGITGLRSTLSNTIGASVARLRKLTKKPIAVGFGISNPDQAKKVSKLADGVIVGSAIVELIAKNKGINKVKQFVSALRKALG